VKFLLTKFAILLFLDQSYTLDWPTVGNKHWNELSKINRQNRSCVFQISYFYLARSRIQRISTQIDQEIRQTTAALTSHRIFLVRHGRRANMALLERFLDLFVGLYV